MLLIRQRRLRLGNLPQPEPARGDCTLVRKKREFGRRKRKGKKESNQWLQQDGQQQARSGRTAPQKRDTGEGADWMGKWHLKLLATITASSGRVRIERY
ncbi:hypothetical protein VTI28DRAFT_964 [Corynascus sepedonium]